jgi:hypothetical protein
MMPFNPQQREVDTISQTEFGVVRMAPLDRWGTSFVWWAGAWVLVVGTVLLGYFLWKQPAIPSTANLTADQIKEALATHQTLSDEFERSLTSIFDLLVTKTALPVVTLMLGYLFGKRQS